MIVSFVWPSPARPTGGVTVLYRFANGLAERGHDIHFIHGPKAPERVAAVEELGWFPFDERIRHHVVDSLDDPALPAADVIFSGRAPRRLGHHALFVQGYRILHPDVERAIYRLRGPKVCVARWLVDVCARFGSPPEQLWHVPIGIDHELFAVRTAPPERRYDVAMLHNPHPTKGWSTGLEALRLARRRLPGLRAVVFGASAPDEPLDDWIEFRLAPDHRELADEVYNASRVFAQASPYEGFGLTAVEAMACGAALVTTDNGGSADYAIDGETAWVVRPLDAEGLADGIVALARDDARRDRLASAGEHYVRRFEWSAAADALEAALLRFVADPAAFQRPPAPLPPGEPSREAPIPI